ncbi:MAG: protein kinase, partial [Planctomycetes bacterium]|nr:protein kinase [Planctomycetota bacterium]
IKPHNLIFGADGHLHITDFGLAYIKGDPHVTMTGEIMGTPSYVSPEQARGEVGGIDERTDIFSLGVTLYELATGCRPFEGETRDQILHAVCDLEPRRPRVVEPRIPLDLETICLKAIEKKPADRYQSAVAMTEDLRRFAEGRPILARRTSLAKKAVKWMRRRPALSSALAAAAALIAVTIGWGISVASANQVQAGQHLEAAYHQLLRFNFKTTELAAEDLRKAEALGASGTKLEIVRALFEIAKHETGVAIDRLDRLIAEDPNNVEAMYMLAWAQRRDGRVRQSRDTRLDADAISGPRTPEEWFLRALAAHNSDPAAAIDSYKNAIKLKAKTGRHYPQAVLHLARAHNQRMYRERTLEPFEEAQSSFAQLIKHREYGGFPYYLMAVANRIAGEIYESGFEKGGMDMANAHFDEALEWARKGQEAAPGDDRPIMAEAFVLERRGRLVESLDARTRAIEAAAEDGDPCEGYHYRWRTAYWLGFYDEALADIERHAACLPNNRHYRYIYPALVYAEMGQSETALSYIERLLSDEPDNGEAVLVAVAGLRFLGQGAYAETVLHDRKGTVTFSDPIDREIPARWLETLYAYLVGDAAIEDLEELAYTTQEPRRIMGEVYFHSAVASLAAGDRERAIDGFRRAYRAFDGAMGYTYQGKLFLRKVRNDPSWPPWIPSESDSADPSGDEVARTLTGTVPRGGD